jgi:hypothetical protein
MKKLALYLIPLAAGSILFSCGNESESTKVQKEQAVSTIAEKNGVYFESWIKISAKPKTIAKKTAYVYYDLHITYENRSKDTIYYLSTTCAGDANLVSIRDKSILIGERELCNYTGPKVNKIAPHKKEGVVLTIGALENKHAIDYAFYFRKVDSNFKVDQLSIKGPEYGKSANYVKFKSKLHPVPQD